MTSLLLVGFFRLLALCPLRGLRCTGRLLGQLLWLTNTRAKRVTVQNIALCFPAMPAHEQRALAKASLAHLAMTALELGPIWFLPLQRLWATISDIDGEQVITQAHQQGQGVIVLAPHIGAWELVGQYLGRHHTITSLYQPPDQAVLHRIMTIARARSGASMVPTNTKGVKALLQALKRGEMVGILPDQVPPKEGGEYADFFAVPALTTTLVKNLAARTGARVVTAAAYRQPASGQFKLEFAELDEAIYSTDTVCSLTAMNRAVERCVERAPEQYQWEYKRFKKPPAGQPKYYQ